MKVLIFVLRAFRQVVLSPILSTPENEWRKSFSFFPVFRCHVVVMHATILFIHLERERRAATEKTKIISSKFVVRSNAHKNKLEAGNEMLPSHSLSLLFRSVFVDRSLNWVETEGTNKKHWRARKANGVFIHA